MARLGVDWLGLEVEEGKAMIVKRYIVLELFNGTTEEQAIAEAKRISRLPSIQSNRFVRKVKVLSREDLETPSEKS